VQREHAEFDIVPCLGVGDGLLGQLGTLAFRDQPATT
jgi:hypothetical protein